MPATARLSRPAASLVVLAVVFGGVGSGQAQLAADEGMTIHTISFTDFADQSLMAQIAAIGGGVHFHVPNYTIEQYTADLQQVFLKLSSHRRAILTQ